MTQNNHSVSNARTGYRCNGTLNNPIHIDDLQLEEQLSLIQKLGCHIIQGYYYSKPVPAVELRATIKNIERNGVSKLKKSA